VGVLPDAPIHAALVQLQETLRSERRGWGWKSLTRHHFAHVVQCRDGAPKTRTVSVQIRPWAPTACSPIRRDVPLKTERLQVRGLPRGPIWNVHRSSEPGLFAKQCVPSGKWCKSTAFRHSCARSSKRAVRFIPRIALDQCRDPERYRTRVPLCPHSPIHSAGVS
jgi:hypothetical protein